MSRPDQAAAPWYRDLIARTGPRLRRRYILGLAVVALDAMLSGVPLVAGAWAIRELSAGHAGSRTTTIAIAAVVGAFALRLVVLPIGVSLGFRSGYASVGALRIALLSHLRRLPLGRSMRLTEGGVADLVTSRFRYLEEEAGYALGRQIGHLALALALIVVLTIIQPLFLVATILLGGLTLLAYRGLDRVFARLAHEQGRRLAECADRMVDFLVGLPVLRTLGQVGPRNGTYMATVEALHRFYRRAIWRVAPLVSAMRLALDAAALALAGLAVLLFALGRIASADVIVALILILLLLIPFEAALGEAFMLRLAIDAYRRAATILALPILPEGTGTPTRTGDIAFEGVSFAYGDRTMLFDSLSVDIPAGKVTAIVGGSGAGKSTLLGLIARSHDVGAGRITIGCQDIRDVPLDAHLARISVIWQHVFLFADTAEGNLRVARADADHKACQEAAAAARCDRLIEALPEGFATRLGEAGRTLSGGERQRIGIARAVLKDADIVLLDEPTSALDAENERDVTMAMRRLFVGKTVVIVAHRLKTIEDADNIIVMDGGRVIDTGTHQVLVGRCASYRNLWRAYTDTSRWQLSRFL